VTLPLKPALGCRTLFGASLALWLALGAFATFPTIEAYAAPLALIWGGDGTENDDPTGTLNSAVYSARQAGFDVQIVTGDLPTSTFNRASVWIQPGGPNFTQAYDMIAHHLFEQIRTFVAAGGGYVGFCGGAYMAQSQTYLGLGLLPGQAPRHGEYTHKTEVNWKGARRFIHFEHGPELVKGNGIDVVASYAWNGAPAAIRGKYGKGRVFITGAHPEALPDWEPVEDPDGPDIDLAVSMIDWAAR
jgi:glutamine amidotransferase-like uncharacterized protein